MPFHRPIPESKLESKPASHGASGLRGLVEAEKLMNLAFVSPMAVAVCGGIGWWVGNRLHQHWIFLASILFGCVAGVFYVIQQAIAAEKNSRRQDAARNGTGKKESREA